MLNNLLNNIWINARNRNIPIITSNTKSFIKRILNKYKPKNCLEIWSAIGYSSIFIASNINIRSGKLIWFEISYPSYKEGLYNIHKAWLNNLTLFNLNFSKISLENFHNKKFDFVFIDAKKNDYLIFLKKIHQNLSENCILIFDDVIKYKNKINWVYSFLKKMQMNFQILQLDDDDWICIASKLRLDF